MILCRRAAAAVLALGLMGGIAGCPDATVEPEPSLLWVGPTADFEVVLTSGTDASGAAVQGEAYIAWQSRLAERIEIYDAATGDLISSSDSADCIADVTSVVTNDEIQTFNFPTDTDPEACINEGALLVRPTADTDYEIRALAGEGNCEQTSVGTFMFPEQCDILFATIFVAPPAVADLSAEEAADVDTLEVTSGSDVTLYLTVDNDTLGSLEVGVLADGALTPCVAEDEGTTDPCVLVENAPAEGESVVTHLVQLTGVTADVTVAVMAAGLGLDGLGSVEDSVEITVAGAPPPADPVIDTLTVAGTDVSGGETATVTADAATLDWTTTDATGGSLESAAVPGTTDCADVVEADWAAVAGFTFAADGTFELDTTASACFRFTATGAATTTDAVVVFQVERGA